MKRFFIIPAVPALAALFLLTCITGTPQIRDAEGANEAGLNPAKESDFRIFDRGEEISINGYKGNAKDVVIPDLIQGKNVTAITDYAFEKKGLTSVVLPKNLKTIGKDAFKNNNLTKVDIPEGVTKIGSSAFFKNKLTEINLPGGVTEIETGAFSDNLLTGVTIPGNLKILNTNVFAENKLTGVVFSGGLEAIGGNSFRNNELSDIIIPDNIKAIGGAAFKNNKLTSVTIPKNVNRLESGAFEGNRIDKVIFENPGAFIDSDVFPGNNITSITIPDNFSFGLECPHFPYTGVNFVAFYLLNDLKGGTYTFNGTEWLLNGTAADYAFVYLAENVVVMNVDSVLIGASFLYDKTEPRKIIVKPGQHEIGIIYSMGNIRSETRSFLKLNALKGKNYAITYQLQPANKISFSLVEQ
ncbi:MAG: leucine-rich repeat domain-containing protein [Treponema sp.]|nr:leucine-rich repeat domain-containing protein [Treponema sp.]